MATRDDGTRTGGGATPKAGALTRNLAARREILEREIRQVQAQLEQLGREAIEQGSLREPGEQGEYFVERSRLEERLDSLRRELSRPATAGLSDAERDALGHRYTIRLADGKNESWELTAPGQANPRAGLLSVQSPLGRALLGKRPGDVVEVQTPEETYNVVVLEVT